MMVDPKHNNDCIWRTKFDVPHINKKNGMDVCKCECHK